MIDQENLTDRHQQVIQKRIMVNLGLLKSGKVRLQKVDPHRVRNLFSAEMRILQGTEKLIHDRMGKPVSVHHQEQAFSENFVMGSDAAEFVNKAKDQVRSRQKRMSNVAESGEEHSIIWGMFMIATMNAATFMGKNFSGIQNSIMNSRDLTQSKCSTSLQNWWASKMR